MSANDDLLMQVFFPNIAARTQSLKDNNTRLVHYCGADAAIGILKNKKFWMRNAKCMNDYQEIEHGFQCLVSAWGKKEDNTKIREALNTVSPNVIDVIEGTFNGWKSQLSFGTYISCFSEHNNSEDMLGRLSMWRGYGKGKTGVAIVMNNTPFLNSDDDFDGLYACPVDYRDDNGVKSTLDDIANNILSNLDLVKSLGDEVVAGVLFRALTLIMICTKHPGFIEEKEWRAVYCPGLQENKHITKDVEIVAGVPQEVYKIPLKVREDDTNAGVLIPELIDKIIIGPTEYPHAVYRAFVSLLGDIGVPDADKKVVTSSIPLRV